MITYSGKLKSMLQYFQSKKGFTLIELLIVVAIISILVSIGAVSFSRVQSQGRDTTRKADLQEVASALEQFYSDKNTYPDQSSVTPFLMVDCGGTEVDWGTGTLTCDGKTLLAEVPGDPQGTFEYRYQATTVDGVTACNNTDPLTTCQRFTLSAKLEREDATCDGTYDLCVNNP